MKNIIQEYRPKVRGFLNWAWATIGVLIIVYISNQDIPSLEFLTWPETVMISLSTYFFISLSQDIKKLQESGDTPT